MFEPEKVWENEGLRLRRPDKYQWYKTHDRWGRPRGPNQPYNNRYNNPGEAIELEGSGEVTIDINPNSDSIFSETSFSENTPLLSETTGAGLSTGTAGSGAAAAGSGAGGTAAAVAAGITGGAAAGGIAYGIYKGVQGEGGEDKKGGLNLPGHKYVGPGNKLDRGPPVDEDDIIAEEHDKAYEKAKSTKEVEDADEAAFQKFLTDWIENGNYHSLLGAIGLKGKAYVEKLTGHLYPNIAGTSTWSFTLG